MDEGMLALLIPIIALIGAVIITIYVRKYQNVERMAMIDKGIGSELLFGPRHNVSATLRGSLLMIGVGIGFLLGNILDSYTRLERGVAYCAMLFICGGLGLGLAYIIEEKKFNKKS